MAELSTIARPYAEALFGVALADKAGLTGWADLMSELAQVAALDDVRAVVSDPHLNKAQCFDLFIGLLKSPLNDEAKNFVSLLIENNRLLLLPEIASQFHDLKNDHDGAADADIVSAFALTDSQLNDLVVSLEKKLGVKIKPTVRVDASLIGGVRVVVGDQVLDTSVSARLAQMRDSLTA